MAQATGKKITPQNYIINMLIEHISKEKEVNNFVICMDTNCDVNNRTWLDEIKQDRELVDVIYLLNPDQSNK